MENTYKIGNTVRFKCEFRDLANALVDPTIVRFKIYNQKYEQIDDFSISESNKESTGVYYYDYIIPAVFKGQKVYYEWYGEISGNPSLDRKSFKVVFI